jgi:plasmid maintenance system antidote protein VapI
MSAAGDDLRNQTRAALKSAGISQASAARALDLSAKHMCQMLTGRARLTLAHAEDILALCGVRLVITTDLIDPDKDN